MRTLIYFLHRQAWYGWAVLLLLLLLAAKAMAGPGGGTAGTTPSLAQALNPDGTLRAGANGSFDARAFTMTTAPDGRPVFRLAGAQRTAGAGDEKWQAGFYLPGANGPVYATVVAANGDVYIGGDFTAVGAVPANRVARWNGTAWTALGVGLDAQVRSLAMSGTDLYVGGYFTQAGGSAASRIAKWNGSAWSALGSGLSNYSVAYALAVSGTDLYVGGTFTQAGGLPANRVAKWNGSTWSALGAGLDYEVYSLAVSGADLYVGGYFTHAGSITANSVAKWNGSTWSALGTGLPAYSAVRALAVSGSELYVGGSFTQAGNASANYIAKWSGSAWSALGSGLNGEVRALAVKGTELYVGGNFTQAGGAVASRVAKWSGSAWSALGNSPNYAVQALAVGGSTVYAGGSFTQVGALGAQGIARWNGTAWNAFEPTTATSVNGRASAVAVAANGDVYVGGYFSQAGGQAALRVARWNGTTWSALGNGTFDTSNSASAICLAVSGTALYVGGNFTQADGAPGNYVARWNGTAWSSLGTGLNLTVYTLAVAPNGDLYAGGDFYSAGAVTANRVARWNGTAWSSLGTGTANGVDGGNGSVRALAVAPNGDVYVGGEFTQAGTTAANYVAKWNGTAWSALGGGFGSFSSVKALAVAANGDVYAGGRFTQADGATANRVARWNGTTWAALGTGLNDEVVALVVRGSDLYAGGSFTTAGGADARNVAKWNGTTWSSLGSGLNSFVLALAPGAGRNVYAAGDFTTVGDGSKVTAYFGVYNDLAAPAITSFNPGSGPVGTSILLSGTGFTGATAVAFNGTAASGFVVNSDTQLTVSVPNGASTGTISITAPGGTATSPTNFTVLVPDLTVSTTQSISGSYNNVTITDGGAATLGGPLSVAGTLTVQSGGMLATACQPITGAGSFGLAAGATLGICDAAGISASGTTGAVQLSGPRTFSPDASYIYAGTLAQSTGNGLPTQVRSLTLANAAGLTLSQPLAISQLLTLTNGNLTTNGQLLTLLSSSTSTALVVNTNGVVNGAATVQRYISGAVNAGPGYRHLAAPVGNTTVADLATSTFTPTVNEAYNASATPGTVAPFPTVFGYDQARLGTSPATGYSFFDRGWESPAALGSPLAVGRGYTVNLAADQVVDFVGSLTSGNQLLSLARGPQADAGWQLVGNPYPAPLDWSLVTTADRPGLDGAMYVAESTGPYVGRYRSFVNNIGNPVLPLGQAFFVRVSDGQAAGTLTLRNAHRLTTPDATPLLRTADLRPQLHLELQGAGTTDLAYIYFEAGATAGFEPAYDARKLPNGTDLNLAAQLGGVPQAIAGLPLLTAATTVPLQVEVPAAGRYMLAATSLRNLPLGTQVYLYDALTGQQTDLQQQFSYEFTTTGTQSAGRFTLAFRPATVTATAAQALAGQVQVYPNPARSRFQVQLPAGTGATTLTLYNALGQPVRTQAARGDHATVEITDLFTGVYTLRVQAAGTAISKRVVIE